MRANRGFTRARDLIGNLARAVGLNVAEHDFCASDA